MESVINKLSSKRSKIIIFSIVSGILFTIILYLYLGKIGGWNLQDFDEARHGVNAYEMIQNNNYVATTYNYEMDYYNLKPPLSEYFIIIGFKIFGYNAVGLRFYSAVAIIGVSILLFVFAIKKIGKAGAIWVLVGLAASQQLFFDHCGRHGDADALYVFLYTTLVVSLLCNKENMRGVYISCLCFSLAFLTKSWHAATCAGVIGLYVLMNLKNLKLNVKKIIISIACALLPILLWGILRYNCDGLKFFDGMINYDLLKRSSVAIEGQSEEALFYFKKIVTYKSTYIIAPPIILFCIFERKNIIKNKNIITLMSAVVIPVALYSCSKTKIDWYIFCIFPCTALLSAYGIKRVMELENKWKYAVIVILTNLSVFMVLKNVINVHRINLDDKLYSNAIFKMVERSDDYKKKRIYMYTGENTWTQKDLLATELAGDFKCENGGYEKWKCDEGSYLVVNNETINNISEHYEIISNYENFYIVKNSI